MNTGSGGMGTLISFSSFLGPMHTSMIAVGDG